MIAALLLALGAADPATFIRHDIPPAAVATVAPIPQRNPRRA